MADTPIDPTSGSAPAVRAPLTPAARRALAEAEARRAEIDAAAAAMPLEVNGRGGLEPARYGDWEVKGLAIDF
jgi:hypothetical protein